MTKISMLEKNEQKVEVLICLLSYHIIQLIFLDIDH